MHRPIGVTILALAAGVAGLFEVWRALVFAGVASFTFIGKPSRSQRHSGVRPSGPSSSRSSGSGWPPGFWNVRAYAWSFGNFISLFTIIFGFFALLGGSTMEAESVGWLLAIGIFFYLNYPGVRDQFVQHELSLMTPEQRAAMEQMQAAQMAMVQATAASAAAPAAAPAASPVPPPPPADQGGSTPS
jgi:uncharacterized membrane protein